MYSTISHCNLILIGTIFLTAFFQTILADLSEEDVAKSIIYDKKTPDVFYCPVDKHEGEGINKMLVKAVPIHRLCEYQNGERPKGYRRDCYQDVDETAFACKERTRIMKRGYPPGMEVLEKYNPVPRTKRAEYYDMMTKNNNNKANNI